MILFFRRVATEFLGLSFGIRITIGVLLGAIGSSSVIGFLSEYAGVSYALSNGIRLPTEGVPYLRYATAGLAFTFFLAAFGAFFGIYGLLRVFLGMAFAHMTDHRGQDLSQLPLKKYLLAFIPAAFAVTQPVAQLLIFTTDRGGTPHNAIIIGPLVLSAMLLTLGRRPQWLHWFTLFAYAAATAAIVILLFIPSVYGQILFLIRFGGGVPIEIKRECRDLPLCESVVSGKLVLRTEGYFVLHEQNSTEVTEIPSSSVVQYRYPLAKRWGSE